MQVSRENSGDILVVDDTPASLRLLTEHLSEAGYSVRPVPSGKLALKAAGAAAPDLVLLDVRMPDMDGYEVCAQLKADPATRDTPVIFISGMDSTTDKVRGFEVGGVDYVTKPVQLPEVLARVQTHLTLRRLQIQVNQAREQAEHAAAALRVEKQKSDRLLYNMLPRGVADVLREGQPYAGTAFEDVTVLHCQVVGFRALAARRTPAQVLELLNRIATPFDRLCEQFGLYKVDDREGAYVVAGGVPTVAGHNSVPDVATMALEVRQLAKHLRLTGSEPLALKMGMHTACVVGGVVGVRAPRFSLFGGAIDIAAQLAETGVPGEIQLSEATRQKLGEDTFMVRPRAEVRLADGGRIKTFFLASKHQSTPSRK